jgi:hypothetical protein
MASEAVATGPEAGEVELERCPLCGGEGRVLNDGDPNWPWVVVWNHNYQCPTNGYGYATEEEAIAAWNTRLSARTPSGGAGEMVAALEGFGDDYLTSEKHHPGYVLIPTEQFDRIRATLSALRQSGEEG